MTLCANICGPSAVASEPDDRGLLEGDARQDHVQGSPAGLVDGHVPPPRHAQRPRLCEGPAVSQRPHGSGHAAAADVGSLSLGICPVTKERLSLGSFGRYIGYNARTKLLAGYLV